MRRRRSLYRGEVTGWRARSIVGALRLRPPRADHSPAEREIIVSAATGARRVVEVGAFEGAASTAIRSAMEPGGVLFVVDPYRRGHLGFSAALVTAKHAARSQPQVKTCWIRKASLDAAATWQGDIDGCVIDAIHTLEGVREDWMGWGRFVPTGGVLVARNDVVPNRSAPAEERARSLLSLASPDPEAWRMARSAGTFTAYERVIAAPANA